MFSSIYRIQWHPVHSSINKIKIYSVFLRINQVRSCPVFSSVNNRYPVFSSINRLRWYPVFSSINKLRRYPSSIPRMISACHQIRQQSWTYFAHCQTLSAAGEVQLLLFCICKRLIKWKLHQGSSPGLQLEAKNKHIFISNFCHILCLGFFIVWVIFHDVSLSSISVKGFHFTFPISLLCYWTEISLVLILIIIIITTINK